ncbi:hypothetical protein JL193_03975 [Polaribacter batillariae]|uniref:Uncharacterized protein n=1 Tax=Polaribacter batillariae TaxID=2808900 RepID=A0ABX7T0B3_9FLAO|nr:hypothetical protein [Polaribacter batillariae]QTD38459.1 hypothetical protein JL193_03975 [Polaribacter batillariae]
MFKKHTAILICFFALFVVSCSKTKHEEASKTAVTTKNGEITSIHGNRKISGIYPHLTTYAHGRIDGTYGFGNECGIGALAVWNKKLYMINYAAHQPKGSEHKLYMVDEDMNMQIFEESIGGTPAARMVHQESNQLFIGPYAIDSVGKVRVIPYTDMKGRLTAIGRHLKDPENMIYYYDMEGMLYEVNVHTLKVNKLFHDPLPGWHGKGGYTSQGRFVVSNNGEHASEGKVTHDTDDWESEHYKWMDNWKIDKEGVFGTENLGILAEFDGDNFKVVERRQYTDVTTKHGIYAVPNDESPLWSMGWDKKSVRLKVLDQGKWYTYLLPKATYNNDPPHGWFTEWPRIRTIGNGKMMMDMHGMFFDFPETFSASNTSGIKPMGSHLRYIPDFLNWKGQIVLATDETSIQGNPLSGQPQSNLWFGSYEQLSNWGPASGYGAIWLKEDVSANTPSDQFLISGFDNRMVHFKNHTDKPVKITMEIDINGDNQWTKLKDLHLEAGNYNYYIFDTSLKAEWLRLIPETASRVTASIHLTDSNLKDASEGKELFSALADIDYSGKVNHAKLYTNKTNFNLSVYNGTIENGKFHKTNELEFTKFDFNFIENITDSTATKALKTKNIWSEDDASIILNAKNYRLRLPKGNGNYSKKMPSGTARVVREVESERELANIAGTFYELPLFKVGQEPLYKMMRPVSTHGKQISDFNTWNGLLVLSGIQKEAKASEHVYVSKDGEASLWFGGIDDIWSFGKPIGEGGPWKDTQVKANELSDMYLMTGYDKKTLTLKADKATKITLLIHVNHYLDEPMAYKTFDLKAGETMEYQFPEGFSAHWIQLKANTNCTATAWFVYK